MFGILTGLIHTLIIKKLNNDEAFFEEEYTLFFKLTQSEFIGIVIFIFILLGLYDFYVNKKIFINLWHLLAEIILLLAINGVVTGFIVALSESYNVLIYYCQFISVCYLLAAIAHCCNEKSKKACNKSLLKRE